MSLFYPRLFRYRDGVWPNLMAFGYALGGYAAGWWLLTCEPGWLTLVGTLLLGHAMIIAAYLIHECAHNTLFADNANNARMGSMLLWLTGACYGTYEGIRHKHVRHHVDRADIVAFDFRPRLHRQPLLFRTIQLLEWLCIPALDVAMHWLVPLMPFVLPSRSHLRSRVLMILLVRGSVFALAGWLAPQALLGYSVAYLLMLHVLRFMDAFQHTYALFETLEQPAGAEVRDFDAVFEQAHTYSNPHSLQYPRLNLFTLNFGYHNAHHEKPNQPWHRLPSLHGNLFGATPPPVIPLRQQLVNYFRYRVARITNEDPLELDVIGNLDVAGKRGNDFIGVDGVSFLTAH